MLKIIVIGSLKEKYLKEAEKEYLKRLSKYTNIEIIEIKEEKNEEIALKKEKNQILKHIKDKDNIVVLDIKGKEYSSIEFSQFIEKEININSNITFIIGSSNGLDEEIKNLSTKKISFSKLTFPHQLFRIILLEQIYRAYKLLNNEKYHK